MAGAFDEKVSTPLCEIMGRLGSDKGHKNITTSWHNYTTFYHYIFKSARDQPLRVFELGLGTNNVKIPSNMGANGVPGASLYGWAEYFCNARIFGADIDRDILFKTDRISTFYCDQTKPDVIRSMWEEPELREDFDIIVEDGLHAFDANVCFFENSIHKLKLGGFYITEDINGVHRPMYLRKIKEWESKFPNLAFQFVCIPSTRTGDNNLMVVRRLK